ncbi:MAG: DUF975 family protein [Bacillota bacterium]|nr:DUF975 family protein [Bacillota bacterium]
MNRSMLKAQARDRIAHAAPRPMQVGLVFTIIILLISFLSYKLVLEDTFKLYMEYIDVEEIQTTSYAEFLKNFDYNDFDRQLSRLAVSGTASFLNSVLSLITVIIIAGMIIFSLNTLRGKDASCWNLFDGFSIFGRVLLLYLLETVFIFLWSLLFFIPGIIAYYRYSQAIFLLIDHPEMSPMACIRESSRLMYGHKWERFVLDLSFIGWLLLVYLGCCIGFAFNFPVLGMIVGIFLFPFYFLTIAGYYRTITGDDIPNNDGWVPEI